MFCCTWRLLAVANEHKYFRVPYKTQYYSIFWLVNLLNILDHNLCANVPSSFIHMFPLCTCVAIWSSPSYINCGCMPTIVITKIKRLYSKTCLDDQNFGTPYGTIRHGAVWLRRRTSHTTLRFATNLFARQNNSAMAELKWGGLRFQVVYFIAFKFSLYDFFDGLP